MFNKLLHHVYCGAPVPPLMAAYMQTAIDLNPTWERKLWTADNLGELGLDYDKLLSVYKKPVHVSDYIRLAAVLQLGGIYLDSDVEVIKPLDSLLEFGAFAAPQDGTGQLCPAIFGAYSCHPWIEWQLDHAEKYSAPDQPWNVGLMTDAPRESVTLVPTDTFYPWLWNTPKPERKVTERTLAIHHWQGSWAPWVIRDRD